MGEDYIANKLKKILESLKDNFIYAKLGGSRSLPIVKNPRDYDIFIICADEEQRAACINLFEQLYSRKMLRHAYHFDFHFATKASESWFIIDSIYPYFVQKTNPLYVVIKDYTEEYPSIEYFLNKKDKILSEYRFRLRGRLSDEKCKYDHKFWYYAYTTFCLFENKSYDLTDEQITNINILHDKKEEDLEKRKELIDSLIDYIINNTEEE